MIQQGGPVLHCLRIGKSKKPQADSEQKARGKDQDQYQYGELFPFKSLVFHATHYISAKKNLQASGRSADRCDQSDQCGRRDWRDQRDRCGPGLLIES